MNAGPAVKPLLRVQDVARLFDVEDETVRVWVRDGKLGAIRTPGGRGLRFRREDVEALLNAPANESGLAGAAITDEPS